MAIIKIGQLQQLGRSEEMRCPELDIKKNKYAKRQVYESFLLSKHFGIPLSHHVSTFPLVFMIQYLILCIAFSFYVCLISQIILCWIRDYELQVFPWAPPAMKHNSWVWAEATNICWVFTCRSTQPCIYDGFHDTIRTLNRWQMLGSHGNSNFWFGKLAERCAMCSRPFHNP